MDKRLIQAVALAALMLPTLPAMGAGAEDGVGADPERPLETTEQQQVSEALQAVEEAWADVESATAEKWRSAKETFDQAVIDLERTWEEVTADGEPPPLADPTSRGSD